MRRSCEVKEEISGKMFQHGKIGQETVLTIGLWSHKRVYLHNQLFKGFQRESHLYEKIF